MGVENANKSSNILRKLIAKAGGKEKRSLRTGGKCVVKDRLKES